MQFATKLFVQKGFTNTTLRSIAKETNVDIYNVQYYFRTKENLLQAIIENIAKTAYDQLRKIIEDSSKNPEEKFRTIFEVHFGQMRASEFRGIYTQHLALAETNDFAVDLLDNLITEFRDLVAHLLKELNPSLSNKERLRRAALIVVFSKGYGIFQGHWIPAHPENKGLEKEAYKHILRIATEK